MASPQWGEGDEAQQALRAIVSNPVYGVPALSNAPIMANLLKDLLPDAPREAGLLIAAAGAGLADKLRDHVSQGVDARTAISLSASSLGLVTAYAPEVCEWVSAEFAVALGLADAGEIQGAVRPPAADAARGAAAPKPQPPATVQAGPPAVGLIRQDAPRRADAVLQGRLVPAMPIPGRDEHWSDSPFALVDGERYTIGWQYLEPRKGGPCFVTLRRNLLGMLSVVARSPLTEEGWSSAWRSLMALDPGAADRARRVLADRARARQGRARRARQGRARR